MTGRIVAITLGAAVSLSDGVLAGLLVSALVLVGLELLRKE